MKDKDKLSVQYVDNPDKVAAIIKHAYSFYCPIRKCRLWADPKISISTPMIRSSKNKEQILNLDTNDSAKGTKRQKTEQAPPVESDEQWVFEWDEPGLKPVDLIKLKEFLEKMGEGVSHLGALVEEPGAEESFLIVKCMEMMIVKNIILLEQLVMTEPILESCSGKEISNMLVRCRRMMMCEGGIRRQWKGKFQGQTASDDTAH